MTVIGSPPKSKYIEFNKTNLHGAFFENSSLSRAGRTKHKVTTDMVIVNTGSGAVFPLSFEFPVKTTSAVECRFQLNELRGRKNHPQKDWQAKNSQLLSRNFLLLRIKTMRLDKSLTGRMKYSEPIFEIGKYFLCHCG
jgi:hypothetical protein